MGRILRASLNTTMEDGSAVMFMPSTSNKSWQGFSYKQSLRQFLWNNDIIFRCLVGAIKEFKGSMINPSNS